MQYAKIVDNKVVEIISFSGSTSEEWVQLPETHQLLVGDDIRYFDEITFEQITPERAVKKGLLILEKDMRAFWENGRWVAKYDFSDKNYWNKETKEKVTLQVGECPDETITDLEPIDIDAVWEDNHWVLPKSVKATRIRNERDRRINEIRWRVERYEDELRLGVAPREDIKPVLEYIQALRDLPSQEGFPDTVIWPKEPV